MIHTNNLSRYAIHNRNQCNLYLKQYAMLHSGYATPESTKNFFRKRALNHKSPITQLRIGKIKGENVKLLTVGKRGIGSPYIWAKDVLRVDASKNSIMTGQSNFLQTHFNPFQSKEADKNQMILEALALNELLNPQHEYHTDSNDETKGVTENTMPIQRDELIISVMQGEDSLHPSGIDPEEQLSETTFINGINEASMKLQVETIDNFICRIPEALLLKESSGRLKAALLKACEVLEAQCHDGKIQSFGFALPPIVGQNRSYRMSYVDLIQQIFRPLSDNYSYFSSLQLPMSITDDDLMPLPADIVRWKEEHQILLIGDRPLEGTLSNGKPFHFVNYNITLSGEEIAETLSKSFNMALSIEKRYRDDLYETFQKDGVTNVPDADQVAWAHILAAQHDQFDNYEEWMYIYETQIFPLLQFILSTFASNDKTKEFSVAYGFAIRELLDHFSASIRFKDFQRSQQILQCWKESGIFKDNIGLDSIEKIALQSVLHAGADMFLLQDQLGATSTVAFSNPDMFNVNELANLTKPCLE